RAVAGEMAMSPRKCASGADDDTRLSRCVLEVERCFRERARPCRAPTWPWRDIEFRLGAALRSSGGNERTSVGPFLWRYVSFIWAMDLSLTRAIVISEPLRRSCWRTRARNASSGGLATRTVRWRFRIIFKRMSGSVNFFRLRFPWLVGARLRLAV